MFAARTHADTSCLASQNQVGKYTTKTLWNEYFLPPWDVWSLASHDPVTPGREGTNIAGSTPSNQMQESWHRVCKRIAGKNLRSSTADLLTLRLPQILMHDAINMPDELCFKLNHYEPKMLRKAIKYLELRDPASHVRVAEKPSASKRKKKAAATSWYVLRFGTNFSRFSVKLLRQYGCALNGNVPEYIFEDELNTPLDILKHATAICSAAHWVTKGTSDMCYPSTLNPANLVCTCKRSRSITLCSHIIVVTALYVPDTYNLKGLQHLVQKLCEKGKHKAHRPRDALDGTRIQPDGDARADSDDEEEVDVDADGFSADDDDPGEMSEDLDVSEDDNYDAAVDDNNRPDPFDATAQCDACDADDDEEDVADVLAELLQP